DLFGNRSSLHLDELGLLLGTLSLIIYEFHSAARRPALVGSIHAPAVGSIFCGLHWPSGLNADRSRSIMCKSSGENLWGMKLISSPLLPCSPVTLPPQRRHSSRISWLASRTRRT